MCLEDFLFYVINECEETLGKTTERKQSCEVLLMAKEWEDLGYGVCFPKLARFHIFTTEKNELFRKALGNK